MNLNIRSFSIFIAITFTLLFTACATMPEKLQKQMSEGNLTEAVSMGEEFLAQKPDAKDALQVRDIVRESAFLLAKKADSVAAYEAFDDKYPNKSFSLRADLLERKSKAFYREVTLPAATAAAAKEFQEKFPKSSLLKDSHNLELKLAWDEAAKSNSISSWKEFHAAYPDHPRVKEALNLETELVWKVAQHKGTEDALTAFMVEYPDSTYSLNAQEKVCQIAWNEAQTLNTVEGYRAFQKKYTRCTEANAKSREKEEQIAWNQAMAAGSAVALEKFVADYPASTHVQEALEKVCDLAWTQAQGARSMEAVKEFMEKYTRCTRQVADARGKEVVFAWDAAERQNKWEGYRDFLAAYPASPHADEAEKRQRDLWGFAGPTGQGELETRITSIDDRDSDKIRLFVQALDQEGNVVGGLPKANFALFENGCPTDMVAFEGMETERPVDVAFVIDTTGSMEKEIDGVKNAAIQFAENLRMRNRGARMALVTFGDEIRGVFDFTSDIRTFQGWVAKQKAEGGGDDPENSLGALESALALKFRPDAQVVTILVTDAPAQEANSITPFTVKQTGELVRSKRIVLFSVGPDSEQYRTLTKISGGLLFDLEKEKDFTGLIETISTMTAKQYAITYKGTACRIDTPGRTARVRARQDYLSLPSAQLATRDVSGMHIDPAEPDRAYLTTRDSGILRSTDGGSSWGIIGADLAEKAFEELFLLPGRGIIARSASGLLFISADGGDSWGSVATGLSRIISMAQDPNDLRRLFATDGFSLVISSDSGATWEKVTGWGRGTAVSRIGYDVADGRLLVFARGGGSMVSSDSGSSWLPMGLALPEAGVELDDYLYFNSPWQKGLAFLVKPGGDIYRSRNSGKSWSKVTPFGADGMPIHATGQVAFDPSKRRWILMSSAEGVYASADAGSNWFPVGEGVDRKERRLSVAVASDGSIRMAGSDTGGIYRLDTVADRELVSGNLYFASGSAAINNTLHGYLENLSRYLNKNVKKKVRVEGHTDDKGDDALNLRLSQQRADSVKQFLVARGVNGNRVLTMGSGKSKPIVLNDSDANRAKNRRVEIVVLN